MAGELALTNVEAAARAASLNAQVIERIADGFGLQGLDLEGHIEGFDAGVDNGPAVQALGAGMLPGFLSAPPETEEQA